MTLSSIARWLVSGSEVQTMHRDWLRDNMPQHDHWTRSQQIPGMALIVSDTKSTARDDHWARLAKQTPCIAKYNVRPFKVKNN